MAASLAAGTAAVVAEYSHDFVSSFDILKPEKWASLVRARGKQGGEFFSTITSLGFKIPTSNESYSHFEDNWIHELVKVGATINYNAANQGADFTLHANSYIAATGEYYVREKDDVLLKDGTLCTVTDISTATPAVVTIVPKVSGITLSASYFVADDE